ncbi:MAG: formimidoylglutamate deiminase [Alphaproteobacteria bacterium]|nr:formimidoylglutamate deiminase [Alphaproteobacteria bacterium]
MTTILCARALLPDGWADDVAVTFDDDGDIATVQPGASGGERIAGAALPGVPNLHSHAHQRAMAGLAERSGDSADSFWTWREVMYGMLERLTPDQLEAIAAQLYLEMLKSGYTSVAEFQYLHHGPDGEPYDDVAEMSLRTLSAARMVGIGFTALPVLYQYGGFGAAAAQPGQRRFLNDASRFLDIVRRLRAASADDANTAVGIALHSLRAITAELLDDVLAGFDADGSGPVHIHIAEQKKEVADCLDWSGQWPVDWLLNHFAIDRRWCLVHATHMTDDETRGLAQSGAVAGLCPTTEANLGDGFFNARPFLESGGRFGIGSDSQISVSPVEELRWLEYGQRLALHARNVLAGGPRRSTGSTIFTGAIAGGAQACGRKVGAIASGYRADLIVVDSGDPLLYGRTDNALLDSWIFSGNRNLVRDVFVGGKQVIRDGCHHDEAKIADRFRRTLDQLAG